MKKKIFALAVGLLLMMSSMAQSVKVVTSDYAQAEYLFKTSAPQIVTQEAAGASYTLVSYKGSTPSTEVGRPNLPIISEFVEIPLCADVKVTVTDIQVQTLKSVEHPLMPVQPAPSKSDKGPLPFTLDSATYSANVFYGHEMAWVEKMGVARDRNVAILRISPLSYNPVTGELQLVTSMKVTLTYEGADAAATQQMRNRYFSPDFTIGHSLLSTLPASKSARMEAPIHYLIVSHSSFRGSLDEFIAWKKRQGFLVTVAYTDDQGVGTTNTDIANYIKGFYTNASEELPAPTFLLLVGDHQQIPAFNARCYSPASDHVTDLYFATWTDGDNIPDCYYGRFSARTVAELTPQISKTLLYEGYDFTDDSYLGRGVLIAGEDRGYSSDNAYQYADPAMDYIAKTYINASNGYNDVHYYKNNTSFAPTGVVVNGSSQTSATAATLRSLYNEGIGIVNYSAHGYDDEWSTPSFNTNHVGAMTNTGKPSVMIGNCCLSGKFNTTYSDACLGEALLRKNNNAGAVAYFGGTNSTYWPHDFCWSVGVRSSFTNTMNTDYDRQHLGMYDKLFHTHNETYSNWHITAGAMTCAGNTAVQAYGSYAQYYWEIYELFGDPSLMPWLGQAEDMDMYATDIPFGTTEYTVMAPAHAYVALTTADEHDLICAAFADEDGNAVLAIPSGLSPDGYEIAVMAQNYKPYFQEVGVIAEVGNSPMGIITSVQPSNGIIRTGQINNFDIQVTNVGHADPSTCNVSMAAETEGVMVVQNATNCPAVRPGDTVLVHNAFSVYVPTTFANQDKIKLAAAVNMDGSTTQRHKTFRVSAPTLALAEQAVSANVLPDADLNVTCRISNSGSDTATNYTFSLVNNYGLLSQAAPAITVDEIVPGSSVQVTFPVTMASSLPNGIIPFCLYATKGDERIMLDTVKLRVGESGLIDFEDGTIPTDWSPNNNPWEITTSNTYAGTYSLRSANNMYNSSESRINIQTTTQIDDSIVFYYKVSSEADYDKFRFYIDGQEKVSASGEKDWTRAAVAVPAGFHILAFSYSKDYSRVMGSDCAWIDNVTMPFTGDLCIFTEDSICVGEPYTFAEQDIPTDQEGVVNYLDTTSADGYNYLALHVMSAPQVSIEVVGTPGVGRCVLLKAHGADNYVWNTGDSTNCIAVCLSERVTYSVTGYRAGCSGDAEVSFLGVQDIQDAEVSLYPNPARDFVTIVGNHIRSIEIIGLMGQSFGRQIVNADHAEISLQNLPNGVYFIRVETPESVSVKKLIKK